MRRTAAALTLSALAMIGAVAPALAAPVETGCPTGYAPKTVGQWSALGYPGPAFIDGNGNADGVVCGHAMPAGYVWGNLTQARGIVPTQDVIYLFRDNDVPAH